tara:strand:+ start:1015 stop:1764 length:750 start_codon:yes stop_codon:yes gene_type:complete
LVFYQFNKDKEMKPLTVLTLTYNRYKLLQEAIYSFVSQGADDCEMLIINDQAKVDYVCDIPNVRIINCKTRFPSIFDKLLFGFAQANNEYVYRLDDDDLLAEKSFIKCQEEIHNNPGYDLYRSEHIHFTSSNVYRGMSGSVNNGNIFSKTFVASLDREEAAKKNSLSIGEDQYMIYHAQPKTYTFEFPSMIYRWGMGTHHISGTGLKDPKEVNAAADASFVNMEQGTIKLEPVFKNDYYYTIRQQVTGQ